MQVTEENLMSRRLETCENCEWCIPTEHIPKCLLKGEEKGLFETCECFKKRTGIHISI